MAKKINNDLTRVSINLPVSIVNRVKQYSEQTGLNITSAYIALLNQALDQKNLIDSFPAILSIFTQFQDMAKIDK